MTAAWAIIIAVGIVGWVTYARNQDRKARVAREWRAFVATSAPEPEHVRLLPPWAPILYDWMRLDWGLRPDGRRMPTAA